MSTESIARWNAIPLTRPEPSDGQQQSLKRPRPQDDIEGSHEDDSEDNTSIISHSPSPQHEAMDIDKYDEYVAGAEREVITVETKIKNTNKGFGLLAKMGWVEGQPLGLSGDGRVEPIPFYVKNDLTGLGKTNQDVRMIESTVSQRRELDSERMIKETEEQRVVRENNVAKRAAVQSEIVTTLRAFYCELCEKQFKNVAQYDEHTNSYAHHHKARFRDMQLAQRATRNTEEEVNKRKEKERKREEKELRKIAKAAGIKMAKPPAVLAVESTVGAPEGESKASGFKKSAWATVASSSLVDPPLPPAPAQPPSPGPDRTSASAPSLATASMPVEPIAHPAFRTAGWTSLDTGSTIPMPPISANPPPSSSASSMPQSVSSPPPPLPLPSNGPASRSSWASVSTPVPPIPSASGWSTVSTPAASAADITPVAEPSTNASQLTSRKASKPAKAATQEAARSGWQQFRGRRK